MQENAINKQYVYTNKLCLHNNDLRLYGQFVHTPDYVRFKSVRIEIVPGRLKSYRGPLSEH